MKNDSTVRIKWFTVSGYGVTVVYADESVAYFGATIEPRSHQMNGLSDLRLRDHLGNVQCFIKFVKTKAGKDLLVETLATPAVLVAEYWDAAAKHIAALYTKQLRREELQENTWSAHRVICGHDDQLKMLREAAK